MNVRFTDFLRIKKLIWKISTAYNIPPIKQYLDFIGGLLYYISPFEISAVLLHFRKVLCVSQFEYKIKVYVTYIVYL